MRFGVLASGGLGLSVLEQCKSYLSPVFIATDSKSEGIIRFAEQNNIPLFKGNPRSGRLKQFLNSLDETDVIFSINYLFLIEQDVISSARFVINFHGSLLPLYRGRTPHVWAIINNEKTTGVTAHLIDEDCDTGDIVLQKVISIADEDTGNDVLQKYAALYAVMVGEIVERLKENKLEVVKQDHAKATYFGKRTPEDGAINWNWHKERVRNWVRAQASPYPGAFSYLDGEKVIIDKVVFSDFGFVDSMQNGLILQSEPVVLVKTPNGVLELQEIRMNRHKCVTGKIFTNEN